MDSQDTPIDLLDYMVLTAILLIAGYFTKGKLWCTKPAAGTKTQPAKAEPKMMAKPDRSSPKAGTTSRAPTTAI